MSLIFIDFKQIFMIDLITPLNHRTYYLKMVSGFDWIYFIILLVTYVPLYFINAIMEDAL